MGYVPKNARRGTTKKIVIKTVVTMPRCKPKRQTTYRQRYNALSALEAHTIGKVQHIWTLCVLHLKMIEQLIVVCLLLEQEDEDECVVMLMLLLHHSLECVNFYSLLDNLIMEITADEVIPRLDLRFAAPWLVLSIYSFQSITASGAVSFTGVSRGVCVDEQGP
jgi:hypothetical protein